MNVLYKNIRERRELLNMTQTDLANKLGYADRSMLCKIEAGKVDLSASKIKEFADALFTTPSALMGWDEDDELNDTLQKAFEERPDMRALFSIAKKSSPEDVQKAIDIFKMLQR